MVCEEAHGEFEHFLERAARIAAREPLFFKHQLLAFELGDLGFVSGDDRRVRRLDNAFKQRVDLLF